MINTITARPGITAPSAGRATDYVDRTTGNKAANFAALLASARAPAPTVAQPFVTRNAGTALPQTALAPPVHKDSLHERALGLRAYRQEILASNIANADTPGYKAVDFDVSAALRAGYSQSDKPALQYRVPSQASADDNSVDMDKERVAFAENALMYEFAVDRVKGHYKEMDELLKGTPY
ncbi:flagellar basal body protein [Massilia sp. P8910]|uniref:flagellar basal body rod protein FlgB n=1 Tax=Massilia antarctica TaxID=2765360 RepID=UPI001E557FEA|nr:flagellar basal body protein [Massilia antarctica]MCE3602821.1 flagellar basal body protein [Massilia antarctica]